MELSSNSNRSLALVGLAVSVILLAPGLVAPVITIRGRLDPEGVATLAPQLLSQGITDQTVDALRPMINPAILPLLELAPNGLKGALVSTLGAQIGQGLKGAPPVEVYLQTRSILGSVKHLYEVGSVTAATLILIFSVLVPFTKILLVLWALFSSNVLRRQRTLSFVEVIAKWSMADVFAVALIISYLAAQASQVKPAPGIAPPVVVFDATFGAGFYWFAGYCLFSLALQQIIARSGRAA